jgi:hypothetical protein
MQIIHITACSVQHSSHIFQRHINVNMEIIDNNLEVMLVALDVVDTNISVTLIVNW